MVPPIEHCYKKDLKHARDAAIKTRGPWASSLAKENKSINTYDYKEKKNTIIYFLKIVWTFI